MRLTEPIADRRTQPYNDGRTPLWCAAYGGHLEVVRWLVENGGSVTQHDNCYSWTPLDVARINKHTAVTDFITTFPARTAFARSLFLRPPDGATTWGATTRAAPRDFRTLVGEVYTTEEYLWVQGGMQ